MLKNYFKTAIRNLLRKKSFGFLNIFGLAMGITCAALIFLWVEDELHYDQFNKKKDSIYAVLNSEHYDNGVMTHWSTPGVLGPDIQKNVPGIVNTCRKSDGPDNMLFTVGDKHIYLPGSYADPSLFNMFTIQWVQGSAAKPFPQLYSVVLSERAANKLFGHTDNLIGKSVRVNNQRDFTISGIVKDLPENSSLQAEWIAPFEIFYNDNDWVRTWYNNCILTYVELAPNTSKAAVIAQIKDHIQRYVPKSISHLTLLNLKDWHLRSEFQNGVQTGSGRIIFVRLFGLIAWIILLIACINFMNLATARSEKRAREVGVRKVLGAGRNGLIIQFIGEALFMALLASVAAGFFISLTLPHFNGLVNKHLSLQLDNPLHILALLGIMLICGVVAGSYPSLYLSSFRPVAVLKGLKLKTGTAASIRRGLVVFQFSISIVLIVCTILVYQQIQHAQNRQMGFQKDRLLEVTVHGDMKQQFGSIRQELLSTGMIESAAISDHETLFGGNNTDGVTWEGKPKNEKVLISYRAVSPEYVGTSGMKLIDGRDLRASDSVPTPGRGYSLLITESLAKMMGKGSAVGRFLYSDGDTNRYQVVGVVADYVYGNIYGKPDPVLFLCMQPGFSASVMYVRLRDGAPPVKALAAVETIVRKGSPMFPFDYRFVDDQFNNMFRSEMLVGKLSRLFAALAVIISCMGLFGLAAYTAERRTKEIGIRKVLGASITGLTGLLSKEFLQLVILSCGVAFPIAWFIMHNWLENFMYRISISVWVFVIAAMLSLAVALITIIFQTLRAAMINPVRSLRSE